jgi:pimeloyl-ACP methyl ester carboxylesterase
MPEDSRRTGTRGTDSVRRRTMVLAIGVAAPTLLLAIAWLMLRGPDIPYAELEAKYAGPGSVFVELPGGLRIHCEETGNPLAATLVLLHGYGDSFTSWERWLPVLAGEYRVIALDLPGHGLTRAPEGYRLTTEGLVAVVEGVAAARGLGRFALAGNSLGGGVAWSYALEHPARLSALILVDAAGWPQPPPAHLPLAFRILQYRIGRWFLRHIDNRPLIAQGLKADVHDPAVIAPAFIDRWAEFQRAPGHRAVLMSLVPGAVATASADALAAIRAPTLVLHGENDPLLDVASGRKFAAAIPGATLVTYPDVGHLPQIEVPERSARDVATFLAAHPPAP